MFVIYFHTSFYIPLYNGSLIILIKRLDVRYFSNTALFVSVATNKLEKTTALASELLTQGDKGSADVTNFIIASNEEHFVT
jgi:hypothetical protein